MDHHHEEHTFWTIVVSTKIFFEQALPGEYKAQYVDEGDSTLRIQIDDPPQFADLSVNLCIHYPLNVCYLRIDSSKND